MKSSLFLRIAGVAACTLGAVVSARAADERFVYDQKPLQGQPVLVAPEQAQQIVEKFKPAYASLGNPRIVIYVNRDLVDEKSGLRISSRNEKIETRTDRTKSTVEAVPPGNGGVTINAGGNVDLGGRAVGNYPGKGEVRTRTEKVNAENRYSTTDREFKLADRQTVRDVERLFGRPLRAGGASLADQNSAAQLLPERKLGDRVTGLVGEGARKDREALSRIADVAVEVLISSRQLQVQEVSGTRSYSVPDIQATAIRLSDSKILGQASSSDILGKDRYAGRVARSFDVRDIAEATALALMEDLSR